MGIDPTFQQLRVFLVVAEELHFGRAAERLHLSQPPVTRHVKALEVVVGVPLFDRTGRSIRLTSAGELIRQQAGPLLRRWDSAAVRARHLTTDQVSPLVLGAVEAMALEAVPAAVAQLRAEHPDLVWELHEGHTHELVEGLGVGRYDVAVVRGPIPANDHDSVPVHDDELVVALPADHHLPGDLVQMSELAADDFVVYSRSTNDGLLGATIAACWQAGFVPRIRHEALGTELLLGLVAAGDGVALVSEVVARTPHPGVRFARLSGRTAVSPIVLAWRPDVPPATMVKLAKLLRGSTGSSGTTKST